VSRSSKRKYAVLRLGELVPSHVASVVLPLTQMAFKSEELQPNETPISKKG
jgi:hypothetical protein